MAIKSTKKVLASILSLAVFSQPFCGATKNFMENKDDPRKSIVIKKEKPTGFDKIKEFAKKHPVKAAVGGVVGLGTVIIVGGIIVKNAFFGDKNDQENILTAEDVKNRNSNKLEWEDNGVLTIKEGITTICENAFYRCENLKEVSIPNSVTTIGVDAFRFCGNLTKVNFEENSKLKEISANAFYKCEKLNSVTIPNGVTTIGNYAFCSCTSLNSVTIPNSVKTIDANAFWNTSLKNVTIPSNCDYVKGGQWRSFPEGCDVTN